VGSDWDHAKWMREGRRTAKEAGPDAGLEAAEGFRRIILGD